ncbi:MAG TPA: Ig domain-containing protein [Candidatus Acidoferrum sp.]|nr:Ig domain-containing protein [Candidatus Acidoferrum sp.]
MLKIKYLPLIVGLMLMLMPAVGALNSTFSTSLTITAGTFPTATQYQAYSSSALSATGGVPPYTWSVTTADSTIPEGMSINASTGVISSAAVGGQGGYQFQVQVTDAAGTTATALETINVIADNTLGGCAIFPADSIFHHRVDSLPVDTSPAAPIPSAYQASTIRPFFGSDAEPGPNGIPFIRVPFNQPPVSMTWTAYPDESDPSPYPFPANAPVEGSANSGGDMHVLVLQTAGGGKNCQLYETWEASYNGNGTWDAANGAHWDLGTDTLRPLSWTSGDAAGLPIMPLTVNYDEVAAGAVTHPIRFTLNHMLNGIVWPARHAAGVGYCSSASGTIPAGSLLSQSAPPVSCTWSGPSGEIYRLKANVDISVCSGSPQSTVILNGMKKYGIILADNGSSGGLIGTPDARWDNSDLACLRNFTLSEFEPVNVSSLQLNADSGATPSAAKPAPPTNLKANDD